MCIILPLRGLRGKINGLVDEESLIIRFSSAIPRFLLAINIDNAGGRNRQKLYPRDLQVLPPSGNADSICDNIKTETSHFSIT